MSKQRGAGVVVAVLVALAGCSGGGSTAKPTVPRPAIGDGALQAVDVVARAAASQHPIDAAPSPDGAMVYFAATGDGGPGIYSVGASGAVSGLASGEPLVRPSAVAVATDGSRLYVADARTGSAEAPGAILSIPITGGPTTGPAAVLTVLAGTEGRAVRGLDVVRRNGADMVYFTGTDPSTGATGLFRIAASGGAVSTVAQGPPFASLDSVVVSGRDVAYVTDRGAVPGRGSVFRIDAGAVTPVVSGVRLGAPAGVTLIDDDATLLVSSNDARTLADQLLFVDLATGTQAAATKVIGANIDSSGGLHRAADAKVLAWADTRGQIFRIRLQ